ncbi:gamma-glutamylaminecyclotransferase C-like [Puntigrus tetrazona]|uniref:gamma-glutamylaminecyclotransferase C-like n=1 Tax=Puntigrus tetrazona TaxID=1606681 RepID=UPI001C89F756|nr:gamma-glutamylaminecyclotransferase C-like [Puntigrus tetrazona]XP_043091670.1 gamma-glutamylaminecyclotransferase C-like [Puntigrus tetrazona]
MQHVFVYGTLKKGQPNHVEMLDPANGRAEFLARARTVEPYPLVIATDENVPFLLDAPGTGRRVCGEIYRVDQKMLEFLDEFEDCPKTYQRTEIRLEVRDRDREGDNIQEAFVYSTITYEPEWLQKPTYESYDANGDHGLKYIDRDTSSVTQQNTGAVKTGCDATNH